MTDGDDGEGNEWDGFSKRVPHDIWVTTNTIIPESFHADLRSRYYCARIGNSLRVPFPFFFIISKKPRIGIGFSGSNPRIDSPSPFALSSRKKGREKSDHLNLSFRLLPAQISTFVFPLPRRHAFPRPRVSRAWSIFPRCINLSSIRVACWKNACGKIHGMNNNK